MLDRRGLGKRPLGAEVGHLQWPLQGQAGRHDFAENVCHGVATERPPVALLDPLQYLGLALGPVVDHLPVGLAPLPRRLHLRQLDICDPLRTLGPPRRSMASISSRTCDRSLVSSIGAATPASGVPLLEVLHKGDQGFHGLHTHRIIDTGPHPPYRTMPFEVQQAGGFGLCKEGLVERIVGRKRRGRRRHLRGRDCGRSVGRGQRGI